MLKYILIIAVVCIAAFGFNLLKNKEQKITEIKKIPISKMKGEQSNMETATLAGGCFWCIETIFNDLKGVEKVVSGYSGGTTKNPSYEEVCSGRTGYAESVEITFDPSVISYEKLLEIFFHIHNPTTLNKQGADVGTQYRSAIFYSSEEQKKTAEEVIEKITKSGLWEDPIVTEVTKFTEFYPAEDYHQDYYNNNKEKSYCSFVIAPKVRKFYKEYKDLLKDGVGN
jgi:peptide-methionine (S)-S-oxide reductase